MVQADPQNTARDALLRRHFALGVEDQRKLHRLGRVVSALSSLAHDGSADTAREPVDVAREDMAALFNMIAEGLGVFTDMPVVSAH